MAFQVDWSPEADEDLAAISEYISRDSEFYAKAVVARIISITKRLEDHPALGREVPEAKNPKIRECLVYSYRVIYRLEENRILLLTIFHGKRLLKKTLAKFEK